MVALAKAILRDGESGQVLKVRMRELVDEGVQQGHLPADVQKKFQKK